MAVRVPRTIALSRTLFPASKVLPVMPLTPRITSSCAASRIGESPRTTRFSGSDLYFASTAAVQGRVAQPRVVNSVGVHDLDAPASEKEHSQNSKLQVAHHDR